MQIRCTQFRGFNYFCLILIQFPKTCKREMKYCSQSIKEIEKAITIREFTKFIWNPPSIQNPKRWLRLFLIYNNYLSLRVFGLSSSSLLLFPQQFGRYVLRPSSGVLSNSGTFTELRTTSFIESTGVACSDSVSHNRVQVLSIPVLLLACSQD